MGTGTLGHSLRRTWSTPRSTHRLPPCIWTFLSSLSENGFFSILLRQWRSRRGHPVAKITRAEVEHVARLGRLELSEGEMERMTAQLDAILGYMEKLNALDTSQVEPTTTVIPMVSVMREDIVRPSLDREEALANAPDRADAFFRVPRIIEG